MPESKKKKPSFEDAVSRLEELIESMESGEIPLADLVEQFEEGTKLLKFCQEQLKSAELKIEQLNVETDSTEPFELDSNSED